IGDFMTIANCKLVRILGWNCKFHPASIGTSKLLRRIYAQLGIVRRGVWTTSSRRTKHENGAVQGIVRPITLVGYREHVEGAKA
ncbi:hypothetical protein, partial [Algoriphagus formosus]|uniref:hypothetical protein n=1 Tax=Algoriphagus formosus TaxID=2007308 RepID=UPI001E5116CF